MPSVDICMPWRATPDRALSHAQAVKAWQSAGYNVIETSDGKTSGTFNVSKARNNAVNASKADIIVIADADTLPDDMSQTRKAAGIAYGQHVQTFLFSSRKLVDQSGRTLQVWEKHHGGLFAIRRDDYWDAGGFDERFDQWGPEDTCFWLASASILGDARRVDGLAISVDHNRVHPTETQQRNAKHSNPGYLRMWLYWAAYLDEHNPKGMMQELVKGNHDGPGIGGVKYLMDDK